MKHVLYLTFYFEPDLCAGSFRNTPLAKELAWELKGKAEVDVITTLPNRYSTYQIDALQYEETENLRIYRVGLPSHNSGFKDQILSFRSFYFQVLKIVRERKYDLVFASSSRLFTAYLGYRIAVDKRIPLYLDIRDIFRDTMKDVLQNKIIKAGILPVLRRVEYKVFNYAAHINLISAGFSPYFSSYPKPKYSFFPNGIDAEFLNIKSCPNGQKVRKTITYAGNLGEGQGLHKIIPQAAKALGANFHFLIIGDGGAKQKLLDAVRTYEVSNVEVRQPLSRKELIEIYAKSDYLFIHLNDYEAFRKVLPSKIFELGAYDKPIIAGVGGYAYEFIKENLSNVILFAPCDVQTMIRELSNTPYITLLREDFIKKYRRDHINAQMVTSIADYL
ncbi:MAG TPA: glycosyltransferase family 4 protein [Candidatus Babeliaceae bacterium]|nr:glycosyltransferase family 4 protein [Candidatus Babeliaceae bacterium]